MGAYRFEVASRGDHLYVRQEGVLADMDAAAAMQAEIERVRDAGGLHKAIFDNRATGIHDERIREAMWAWVTSTFDQVALLLDSSMAGVRANMNAVAAKAQLRAFADPQEALEWLRGAQAETPKDETGSGR